MPRSIATPTTAKHQLFAWLDARICPDHQLIVIARDDDTMFGILHNRFHEAWLLRLGTSLEDRPRYTLTATFETFPFPDRPSPEFPATEYAGDPPSPLPGLHGGWSNCATADSIRPSGWNGSTNRSPAIPSARSPATKQQLRHSRNAP